MLDPVGRSPHDHNTANRGGPRSDRAKGASQLAVVVLPSTVALLTLLLAAGSPRLAPYGLLGDPRHVLLWAVAGALAALHRPFAALSSGASRTGTFPTLGLGAVVLPPVLMEAGSVPAAIVAALVLLGSESLVQSLPSARAGAEGTLGRLLPALERAGLAAFAVLVTGALLTTAAVAGLPLVGRVLAVAISYVALFAVTVYAVARLRGRRLRLRHGGPPLAVDGLGWIIGGLLTGLLTTADGLEGRWVWWILALLSAEAARNAALRHLSDHRVGHFERLRQAHVRILSETSGMGDIAQQVLEECRNILPAQWFHFELACEDTLDSGPRDEYWQSWAAGPDGLVVEGRPRPSSRPSMLPGIHRRAPWKIVERQLVRRHPDEGELLLARFRLWCDPRRIEPGAEELLDTLVPQMASSVHRALLDREAKLDPLTGVPVRRVLESRMQRAYRRCIEEGVPMAVIMCDIDFFKKVNDTHGHAAGDEALKLVAATLDGQRRDNDLCCRYGGEEFTVLLERTHGEDALRLAERLRRAIEALHFEFEGRHIPLTLSLGVAAFPELHIKTAGELLLLADEALYEAKARGRNQCMLHIGNGAFRPATSAPPQDSSTAVPRPVPGPPPG